MTALTEATQATAQGDTTQLPVRSSDELGEEVGNIVVKAELEKTQTVVILITDDGMGIDAADLPHVFDRFYRTEQSRSSGIPGTGLGLAIARATVEAHGGRITASSNGSGQGVTFTIRLPLNEWGSSTA